MFDSGHLSHCSEHAMYMLIYAQNRSTAKKMPQPGKALLSIGKPVRQAAPREELMLSECTVVCYCEGDQFNSQVKIIYHGKIPTKFCTVFLVLAAVMWIRDLRSQMPLSIPALQSHPLHIQVCQERMSPPIPCLVLQDTFNVAGYWEFLWPLIGNSVEEILLLLIFSL